MRTQSCRLFLSRVIRGVMMVLFCSVPFAGWGMIYIDVTDSPYNAVPNDGQDDSAAFQSALNALKTAGGGYLYIPDGGYGFDSVVAVTNGAWALTIQGQSTAVRLYSTNPDGIFRLNHTSRAEEITIRDLSLVANYSGAGTAIEVTSPQGGVQAKRILTVDNLSIRYYGTTNYFNKGIVATGIYRPLISNCSFRGPTDTGDLSDTSLNFKAEVGYDVSDSYAPVLQGCSAQGVDTAYYMVTATNAYPEDGAFRDCSADYCKVGIKFYQTTGTEPSLWVRDCDICARDYGVWVKGRRNFQITDNSFSQLSTSYALKDIQLDHGHLGVLLRNSFSGSLSGGRVNVVVDDEGQDLILAENSYAGATNSAIQVDASAVDVFVY